MTLKTKPFNQMFSFSRAGGATRVNAAGLIVGVDFSPTSNTIGTGSKTFTLTADANVNRDWAVDSNVIAVSQAGATGSMTGTVASYNASTQELVINVSSITGSGTSTDWRIGSLEFRRDFDPVTLAPRGGLVEGGVTCLTVNNLNGASYSARNGVIAPTTDKAPDGSSLFHTFTDNSTTQYGHVTKNAGSLPAGRYTVQVFVKKQDIVFSLQASEPVSPSGVYFNALTGERITTYNPNPNVIDRVIDFGDCFFYQTVMDLPAATYGAFLYSDPLNAGRTGISPANTESVTYFGLSLLSGDAISFVPTTTVSVSKAADLANIDGARFSSAYNQSQGTIYVEMTPLAGAVQAVAASINDGTVNNAIRVGQKQSGTLSSIRAIASDGVTDVMALNASGNNTMWSNGIDYIEVADGAGGGKFGAASSGVSEFLLGGASENIYPTQDSGLTYTPKAVNGTLAGAHFGIGRFVIASNAVTINGVTIGSVIVSTDGLTFRRVNIAGLTQNLNEVTSNGVDQYVAVGNGGVIYTSPDAEVWTAQVSGSAGILGGVHYFGGRYVATVANAAQVRYSDDGVNWLGGTGNVSTGYLDVYHNGTDLWVCVGAAGAISTSPDGITWTPRTSGVTVNLSGVHFADGLWVAVGAAGTVVTSPDGITWTDRTATSGVTSTLNEVGFFGGKFYYVGAAQVIGENTAANIVAGVTWTARTANVVSTLAGIATNGSRLLVCGSSGAITTSDDGITFTSRTGNAAQLNGAAFGAGTYVVVGNAANGSGLIATVDPTTFAYTRRVSGTTGNINGVRYLNGAFYALSGGAGTSVLRSTDGIAWTSAGTINRSMYDVAYNGSLFVAASTAGVVVLSSDGVSFNASTLTGVTTATLNSIDYANGLFVAVAASGTIITSPNGTTWTARTSGTTVALYAVRWNTRDQCFYAAGDAGVILRSADGITWENIANDAIGAVIRNGSIQSNPQLQNLVVGIPNKVAMRIKENDFAVSVNGSDPFKDTSGTVPTANRISLGMSGVQTFPFNGHIRKLNYYPGVMPDSELKEITGL